MKYGMIKVASAAPEIRVADSKMNAGAVLETLTRCEAEGIRIAVFPELGLTSVSCGDLFFQETLLEAGLNALRHVAAATQGRELIAVVGLPLRNGRALYNVAAVAADGKVIGFVPKAALETTNGKNEVRWFTAGDSVPETVDFFGKPVPFGRDLLFSCAEMANLRFRVEFSNDSRIPLPAYGSPADSDATLILILGAEAERIGAAAERRTLLKARSMAQTVGIVYASAGAGESTTDAVYAGHGLILENGAVLAERKPFETGVALSEIDVDELTFRRMKMNGGRGSIPSLFREIPFSLSVRPTALTRRINAKPFVPADPDALRTACATALSIQSAGLKQRVLRSGARSLVLGVSGGLDSTLALLVVERTLRALERPMSDLIAVTMPGFGTTSRTKSNAIRLSEAFGATVREISIVPAVMQHFADLGHDPADHTVLYENAQARERTQILMDICHQCGGIVVGTGDLSELALGWATYNGDHMSMYGVNGGIPKTLIREVIRYAAETSGDAEVRSLLYDILDTPVSPELLPASGETMTQLTESILGPYDLHDFFIDAFLVRGYPPRKALHFAEIAFEGKASSSEIRAALETFIRRFFSQQFKRSCLPDGPMVTHVSLSPRSAWIMASDASAQSWLADLAREEAEDA